MHDQQNITFFPSGAILVFCLALVTVAGVLCWLAWHRGGYRKATGLLELLRFVLVCLVALTLNQPEWLETQPPDQRPTLAVLWDQSNSMKTRDVIEGQILGEPKSRAETIEPLLSKAIWKPAAGLPHDPAGLPHDPAGLPHDPAGDLNVVFEPFSSNLDPAEEATDLNAGLSQVLENHSNLRGVVVLSDGDWNVGKSPVEAATRFRMKGIPVFAVGVGSKVPLPDLEVVSMHAPTFGVANKPLRIPFVVRSTLGQDREVSVTLNIDEKPTITRRVRVPAMGQAQENMVWTPPATGDYTLTLRVPRDAQELIAENNEISAPISVRQEQLKVLGRTDSSTSGR